MTTPKHTGAWTAQQDRVLTEMYPCSSNQDIAEALGRKYLSVKNRARKLGLKKSAEYLLTKPGSFRAGQKAWNKGINFRAGGRSAETQFGENHKPHNFLAVGSFRVIRDGILQRKVNDTGYPPADWCSEQKFRWEEYHGRSVPDGHIVRFRDGDRRNFDEHNLVLVTRGENVVLNKFFAMESPPKGGFDVLLNLARIKLTVGRRKREVSQC